MKQNVKILACLMLVIIFLISMNASAIKITKNTVATEEKIIDIPELNFRKIVTNDEPGDIDPLIDLELTVTIKEIRALDKIDRLSDPDFYVKVYINDELWWTTDVWKNQKYIREPISNTIDVPDDEENVSIKIQLWDKNLGLDRLCDISGIYTDPGFDGRDIDIMYNLKTGHWRGDDYNTPDMLYEPSGYGHANGCDDNTYNREDRDCEIFFDITQNDYDGDGIPYWTEMNVYNKTGQCDPTQDDSGRDDDNDGVPIEWEHKWGHYFYYDWHDDELSHYWFYDPFVWENHSALDIDEDGLQNTEEYLTSQWGSDPHRQDIFLELDEMEVVDGKGSYVTQLTKDLLIDAYARHNIIFYIDDYIETEMDGGELIPFDEEVYASGPNNEVHEIYRDYFLHGDYDNWRQGVFHYGMMVYFCRSDWGDNMPGFATRGGDEGYPYADTFLISTSYHDEKDSKITLGIAIWYHGGEFNRAYRRASIYAGTMMHETGHILGIHNGNTPGCDNRDTYKPRLFGWWKYGHYRSCMNYRFTPILVQYSDGSHGKNDFDDWDRINLKRFQGD